MRGAARPGCGAICAGSTRRAVAARPPLQFGDQLVYFGTERQWAGVTRSASRAGLQLREHPGSIESERLHVVIQKGRLFQREHPDVPVLVDKGRYLLVDIDPDPGASPGKEEGPLLLRARARRRIDTAARGEDRVVFAARDSSAERAAARAPDPAVQALVDRISRATFEADLAELVALPTRFSTSTHYQRACDIVEQKLASFGYATSRQTISVNGSQSTNVVARRAGTGPGAARRGAW